MEISELIPLLKANGVKRYKAKGVEIEFESTGLDKGSPEKAPEPTGQVVEVPEPPNMPPDLRADDLMNMDKVLHWSSSPDQTDTSEMPLTGDAPIDPPEPIPV